MINIFRKDGKFTRIEICQAGRNAAIQDYNSLMIKYEKAQNFMNDEKVPAEKKLLQVPRLKSLTDDISACLTFLKLIGEDWEAHKWIK